MKDKCIDSNAEMQAPFAHLTYDITCLLKYFAKEH